MDLNPEIQRNLWREFSFHRILAGQVLIGFLFFIATQSTHDPAVTLMSLSGKLFILLVFIWGVFQAAGGITEEVNNSTWDFKRLSAMTPMELLLGKLFSASYSWYLGLTCLLVYMLSSLAILPVTLVVHNVTLLLVGALLTHLVAIAAAIQMIPVYRQSIKRFNTFGCFIVAAAIGMFVVSLTISTDDFFNGSYLLNQQVQWFTFEMQFLRFLVALLIIMFLFAFAAAHWAIRHQLRMRTGPWLWVGFVLFMIFLFSGLAYGSKSDYGHYRSLPSFTMLSALMVAITMTYVAVFMEKWGGIRYRKLRALMTSGRTRDTLDAIPAWFLTLVISVIVLLAVGITGEHTLSKTMALAFFLFILRDIAIMHYFALKPGVKRAQAWTVFYLLLLYGLIPIILSVIGQKDMLQLFTPLNEITLRPRYINSVEVPASALPSVISAAFQAFVMGLMALLVWKRHWSDRSYLAQKA